MAALGEIRIDCSECGEPFKVRVVAMPTEQSTVADGEFLIGVRADLYEVKAHMWQKHGQE